MPEGDTVWLAGKNLNAALAGQVLTVSDFRVPQLAEVDLTGQVVTAVVSRGKHLLTRFEGGRTLHTHFRMDGSWHLYRPGDPWRGGPDWQVRVILGTADRRAVGYRLPVVDLLPTSAEHTVIGHLGPDLLGPGWDADEALRRLLTQPDRAIGAALLDQRNLAGLGNLYRTETCFLAGVSPWTPVGDIAGLARLVERGRALIDFNKERSLQVTTGDARRGRWHWIFEQSNCLRCGTRISTGLQDSDGSVVLPPGMRNARAASVSARGALSPAATGGPGPGGRPGAAVGMPAAAAPRRMTTTDGAGQGRERITYWCPRCQPGPGPESIPVRTLLGPPTVGRTRYAP